jgi:hypothetical protein
LSGSGRWPSLVRSVPALSPGSERTDSAMTPTKLLSGQILVVFAIVIVNRLGKMTPIGM